jgi:hypothetical protein
MWRAVFFWQKMFTDRSRRLTPQDVFSNPHGISVPCISENVCMVQRAMIMTIKQIPEAQAQRTPSYHRREPQSPMMFVSSGQQQTLK